jgi:hypothetical protein
MSYKITYLKKLAIRNSSWFALLWNDIRANTKSSKRVKEILETIHDNLGKKITALRTDEEMPEALREIREDILTKRWPVTMKKRLEETSEPVVLVWAQDFDAFDPQTHDWFALFFGHIGSTAKPIDRVTKMLVHEMAKAPTSESLFREMDQIANRRSYPFDSHGSIFTRTHLPEGDEDAPSSGKRGRPQLDWDWFAREYAQRVAVDNQASKKKKIEIAKSLIKAFEKSHLGVRAPKPRSLVKNWRRIVGLAAGRR